MPRSPEDNLEIRTTRADAIVDAATQVFAAKGFARSTVTEIAARAGLSHGLVYHYFPSKDAVLAAIATRMTTRLDREMEAPYPRAIDRLVASMERHHARLESPVDELRVVMHTVLEGTLPEPVRAALLAHFRRVFERLASWIALAQTEGDIEADVPATELAGGLISMFRGMSLRLPGFEELPFEPPTTATITRMLCLTASGRARIAARKPEPKRKSTKRNSTKKAARAARGEP